MITNYIRILQLFEKEPNKWFTLVIIQQLFPQFGISCISRNIKSLLFWREIIVEQRNSTVNIKYYKLNPDPNDVKQ